MNKSSSLVRVRIAPSPTGYFHLGTARTSLFNWLFARKTGGIFIVRIEDTDRERSRPEYEKDILESLSWLGLDYGEFYRQSERMEIYKKYLKILLESGKAFYCSHTKEELEKESEVQRTAKEPPRHICSWRTAGLQEGIIRFKNEGYGEVIVFDIIRKDVRYQSELLGDFSLAKSIDEPLYNFAAVVDDAQMEITHVIRGEDHLPNTPKQILLERALNFKTPLWAHLPLLLGSDRSKLSKRHGALSLNEYRSQGYLAEAMVNFIALLGWHPLDEVGEVLSTEELIREFSLERIQKGGAIVSFEKLDWFNREYIKKIPTQKLVEYCRSFVEEPLDDAVLGKVVEALRRRITRLEQVGEAVQTLLHPKLHTLVLLSNKGKIAPELLKIVLDGLIETLAKIDGKEFNAQMLEARLWMLVSEHGKGNVLWPLRTALSAEEASPGPYELAYILGKDESLRRLKSARMVIG